MNYCIYKLNFQAPLHTGHVSGAVALTNAGMTLLADTVFSAVCNEAGRTFGNEAAQKIIELCREDKLTFSDTFPYCNDVLYLPKPVFPLDDGVEFDVENRKSIKAVEWLPADKDSLSAFGEYIHSGKMFDTSNIPRSFAKKEIYTKASIRNGTSDAMPYRVGVYEFNDGCGLYGIIGYESDDVIDFVRKVFTAMSFSGIGGFISGGCGRFLFEIADDDNAFAKFITGGLDACSDKYMLLTSALPKENEIEKALQGGYYSIVRRGGFSFSAQTAPVVKKKTQYFIGAGAILRQKFEGDLFEVGNNGRHCIYRYSKPMFLGVNF